MTNRSGSNASQRGPRFQSEVCPFYPPPIKILVSVTGHLGRKFSDWFYVKNCIFEHNGRQYFPVPPLPPPPQGGDARTVPVNPWRQQCGAVFAPVEEVLSYRATRNCIF